MRLNYRELIVNFMTCCVAGLLFLLAGPVVSAQEVPQWNKKALRDSVISLLSDYQILHNQLNARADAGVERDFIHLFSNPKIKVLNNLDGQTNPGSISAEDYMVKVAELFPDGLDMTLDLAGMDVGKPVYDRNNRYVIKVRTGYALNGISGGKVFSSGDRIIFQIAFYYTDSNPGSFVIYGIEPPDRRQSIVTASFSPAFTGYVNQAVGTDDRLFLSRGSGFTGGISYAYFFSDHWGIAAGAQYSRYSGSIGISQFDAIGGFNPAFRDVSIENTLWFVELPVGLSYRTNPSKRFGIRVDAGLVPGARIFEEVTSSAVNMNTGTIFVDIFSDPDWIEKMNRFNFAFQATIAMNYRFGNRLGALLGLGMRQGLTGLDNNTRADFVSSKYQGQYNPLWGAPGQTVTRAYLLNAGIYVLINK
jgi:hypothetical protein